jgi:hypothetical protein
VCKDEVVSVATFARKPETASPAKTASTGLRIAAADSVFEREADRTADEVTTRGAPSPHWSISGMDIAAPLQRKPTGSVESSEVPQIVHEVLRSPGRPLDRGTRDFFERRFGHDFGHVRVHHDTRAAESARAVHAHAYSAGHNVVFGANELAPETHKGRELLAHELTHTIQQRDATTDAPPVPPGSALETQANSAGQAVAQGLPVGGQFGSSGFALARQVVTPRALPDDELAQAIQDELKKLKKGDKPGEWLRELQAEAQRRTGLKARQQQEDAEEAARVAAAERPRKEREAAIAEATAVGTRAEEPDDEEAAPVPMALAGGRDRKVAPAPRKKSANVRPPSKFDPGGFHEPVRPGGRILTEYEEASEANLERLEAAHRRTDKRKFDVRVKEARERAPLSDISRLGVRRDPQEVWDYGLSVGLFAEDEKEAVWQTFEVPRAAASHRETEREKGEVQYQQQLKGEAVLAQSQAMFFQPPAMSELGAAAKVLYWGTGVYATGKDMARAYQTGDPGDIGQVALDLGPALAMHSFTKGGPRGEPVGTTEPEPAPSEPLTNVEAPKTEPHGEPPQVVPPKGPPNLVVIKGLHTPEPNPPAGATVKPAIPANENAVPQALRAVAGDPVKPQGAQMTRRVVPAPKVKQQVGKVKATGDSDVPKAPRNLIQEKTVKEQQAPEDTHSVKSDVPGALQPERFDVGNFAEKNFNSIPEALQRAGIKSSRPISKPLPAGTEKYRIEGYQGYSRGHEPEIDALDRAGETVYEVKPHHQYDQGLNEARGYAHDMDRLHPLPDGRKWKYDCVTYDPDAVSQYVRRLRK